MEITAVDVTTSKNLMLKVKTFPEVNEYRVYESIYLDNIFEILMIPGQWSYESMEAWYPGTVWNPNGSESPSTRIGNPTTDAKYTRQLAAATTAHDSPSASNL